VNKKIKQRLSEKILNKEWLTALRKLSGSELNTVLLEVFRNRVEQFTPSDVLKQFGKSRFAVPSTVRTIDFKELEVKWLKFAQTANFIPISLSPVAPLGTCSVFGTVDQNNVVSAVRGAEIVSDVTNVLALLISQQYKKAKSKSIVKYSTTHRHVRGQAFTNPAFTAHFGIFCLVTGGLDSGGFSFETSSLLDHLNVHLTLLSQEFDKRNLSIKFYLKERNEVFSTALKESLGPLEDSYKIEIVPVDDPGDYYRVIQFKIFLNYKNEAINIVDGGVVDWTQKLTSNRKHRLFISGSGIELVHKILIEK
jgi:hypothetical protein